MNSKYERCTVKNSPSCYFSEAKTVAWLMGAFSLSICKNVEKVKSIVNRVSLVLMIVGYNHATASECRMFIAVKNDTGSTIAAALFNESDQKLSVLTISAKSDVTFQDLCANKYKVVFKDSNKYTETEPIDISFSVTAVGNSTTTNRTNGTARYFVTKGRSSGRPAAEKYRF